MDYTVEGVCRERWVEASVHGDFVSVAHALRAWLTSIGPLLRTYDAPRLLIVRGPGKLAPPAALCEIVIAIKDLGFPDLRAAMVSTDVDWCALITSVAASRGIEYRAFTAQSDAEAYLQAPDDSSGT